MKLFSERIIEADRDAKILIFLPGLEHINVYEKLMAKSSNFSVGNYTSQINDVHEKEYQKRLQEIEKFVNELNIDNIKILPGRYNPQEFFDIAKGLEEEKERGKRCYYCYQLRLEETAKVAEKLHFDYFTTTLSISPYKKIKWLN